MFDFHNICQKPTNVLMVMEKVWKLKPSLLIEYTIAYLNCRASGTAHCCSVGFANFYIAMWLFASLVGYNNSHCALEIFTEKRNITSN